MAARFDPEQADYPLAAVAGPTASGKSGLALEIARRFNGEVVNFDSVQVYRGFDVGTAKVPPQEREGVPHHLLDILDPQERMSAGAYARCAREVLAGIRRRGRLPVFAGGTGFYLRAALEGLFPGPGRDEALRRRLQARAGKKGRAYLHRLLRRLDAESAGRIHPHDTAKVIRAIEVSLLGRAPMSRQWRKGREPLAGYRALRIGLDPPRHLLRKRIEERTRQIYERGLVEEVRDLLARGAPRDAWPFSSLGYRQALEYLEGKLTLQEAVEATMTLTRQYAKRQMTWFRREPVHWFTGFGDEPGIQRAAIEWLEQQLRPHWAPGPGSW